MKLEDALLSAFIALLVAIIPAIITYLASQRVLNAERDKFTKQFAEESEKFDRQFAQEREKFERQLQRPLTEKLYDKRISAYPQALQITEALRRSRLWQEGQVITKEYLNRVEADLDEWESTKAAFLMSDSALAALDVVRRSLRAKPDVDGKYSDVQLKEIWDAKNKFRTALRNDIFLLYGEEREGRKATKEL
jgi:hypothetical protein